MAKTRVILESEEDMMKFLAEANKGMRLVLTKHGVVNPASVDSIIPHKELNDAIGVKMRMRELRDGQMVNQYTLEQATRETLPRSPFQKLLANRKVDTLGSGK